MNLSTRSICLAAFASTSIAHAQQLAQPTPVQADHPVQQVEVAGTAADYDPRRDDTASRIVLGHADIIRYGDGNVFEVLKRVPGITIGGSGTRAMEIRMRGLGNGYTQVLLNGERLPSGFSIESLAPESIERIEIMRVATAEFSTQSIAGTVNIVLKKAVRSSAAEV